MESNQESAVNARKVAIVLPAYNEELTIADTITAFYSELPDAEIWVINNSSLDSTERLALETLSMLGAKGGVIREMDKGKGNAIRRAFHCVDADIYVMSDADMTYPAEQIHDLLRPVLEMRADMVVGDRHSGGQYHKQNKRLFHNFGNLLVQRMVNKLFKADLVDIMSGYRVFSRAFVKNYPILVSGFEIETDITLHALDKRMRIIEIPVDYRERPHGSFSKLNTLRDGVRIINTITTVLRYYRPLLFFGSASICFALCGLLAGIPVLEDWIRARYIYHIPLAILATGLEVIAIVFAAIGLILDAITYQEKRRFERELLNSVNCLTNEI